MGRPVITLLTDFGLRDSYVGTMKGVLVGLLPDAVIVDICHELPPQDIRRAGIVWRSAVPFFPPGTVHVGVVDPGVGTRRKILAVEAGGSIFIAPDNGILGYVIGDRRRIRRAVEVRRRELFLHPVSNTFHGRDIFAPVAARVAGGLSLEDLGPRARPSKWERLPRPRLRRLISGRRTVIEETGEITSVDTFGNVLTNLLPREGARLLSFHVGDRVLRGLSTTYASGKKGEPLVLAGSAGYLEVAVNQGCASERLGLAVGGRARALWADD